MYMNVPKDDGNEIVLDGTNNSFIFSDIIFYLWYSKWECLVQVVVEFEEYIIKNVMVFIDLSIDDEFLVVSAGMSF